MLSRIDAHRFLYRFIKHQISLSELEQWIYCHDELESILGKTEYLDFISIDYSNKYAFQETEKQVRNMIDPGNFEQERIKDLLNRLIQNDSESLCILETLYDDYCGGFTFLRYIALYFITTSDEYKASLINDLVKLQEYIFPIKREADRLLAFLRNGELSIISEDDYFDSRTEADRKEIHSINEMMNDDRKT